MKLKHILPLLFLLCVEHVQAQITNLSSLSNTATYTIENVNRGILYSDPSSTNVLYKIGVSESDYSRWTIYFHKEKSAYYLYNVGSGKFVCTNNGVCPLSSYAAPIQFYSASGTTWIAFSDNYLLGFQSSTTVPNDIQLLNENGNNQCELTFTATSRTLTNTEVTTIKKGIEANEISASAIKLTTLNADGTFPNDATWYQIRVSSYYTYYAPTSTNGTLQSAAIEPDLNNDAYLWCFVGTNTDNVKIYNKSTATTPMAITGETTINGTALSLSTTGSDYTLCANTKPEGHRWTIKKANISGNAFLNRYNGGANTTIKYYSGDGVGSDVAFTCINLNELNEVDESKNILSVKDALGTYTSQNTSALQTAYDAYIASKKNSLFTKLKEELHYLKNNHSTLTVDNTYSYYRIMNYGYTNKVMYGDNTGILCKNYATTIDPSMLWKLEKTDILMQKILKVLHL
ncbi:MAG: hypothetical protein RR206_09315 [Bacteroidaceae bacterium]